MPTTRDKATTAPPITAPAAPSRMPAAPGPRGVEVHSRPPRNPGAPLDLDWALAVRVNRSAVQRRAPTIPTLRTVKKQRQAAWLRPPRTRTHRTTLPSYLTPRY